MSRKTWFYLSVLLFIFFIIFSYFVARNYFTFLDFDITVKLQDKISRRFDLPFSYFSLLGSAEVTALIWVMVSCVLLAKKLWGAFFSMVLFPIGVAIEVLGKLFINQPAPPFLFYRGLLELNLPSHYVPTLYAYPSGHSLRTTYLIIFLLFFCYFYTKGLVRILLISLLLAVLALMYLSRVYLGEHWTSDVVGGAVLGASLGLLSAIFLPRKSLA